MTAENLFLELGNVDERYLTGAMTYHRARGAKRPFKWLAAAAVLGFLLTVGVSVSAETIYYRKAVEYLSEKNFDVSQMSRSEIKRTYREEKAKDPYTQRNEVESELQGMQPDPSVALLYESMGNGECRVKGVSGVLPEELVIPAVAPSGELVCEIGEKAFYGRTDLKRVVLSEGVHVVREQAFGDCIALEAVYFHDVRRIEDRAFENCTALKDLFLGEMLGTIGRAAFWEVSLDTFVIPPRLKYCAVDSFWGFSCNTLCYYGSEEEWKRDPLYRDVLSRINVRQGYIFHYGQEHTEGLRFYRQSDGTAWVKAESGFWMESLRIPEVSPEGWTVTGIDAAGFRGNQFLKEVVIPPTVTVIGEYAFAECTALESIVIPDTVETLNHGVFKGCTSLKSATLPKGLKRIPNGTFRDCTSLESFSVAEQVEVIGAYAFSGCVSLCELDLPEALRILESSAFANCDSMVWSDDSLPSGLIYIGESALDPCFQLPTMSIEEQGAGRHPQIYDENGQPMSFTYEMYVGKYLICVASTEPYTVREGTELIACGAVADLYGIGSVTLPESLRILCSDWLQFRTMPYRTYYNGTAEAWANVIQTNMDGSEQAAGSQPMKAPA